MSSGQGYDFGVPALLGVWMLVGGYMAVWLQRRLTREFRLSWGHYLGLVVVMFAGPLAVFAVAGYLTTRPRSRVRP